jgi:hypothetical protein
MRKLIVILAGLSLAGACYGQTVSVVAETGEFIGVPTAARIDAIEAGTKLPLLASGKIIVGNSGGTGTAVTVTGDFTVSNAGVGAIASGVIVNADVATNAAIASTKLSGVAGTPAAAGSVSGTTNTVTVTVKDGAAETIAARRLVRVWMSEAAYGVPSTNNIESVTLSGGTAIQTVTAAADYVYVTGTNGTASAVVIGTAAGTNYVNVADGGYVTSAAVVFQ